MMTLRLLLIIGSVLAAAATEANADVLLDMPAPTARAVAAPAGDEVAEPGPAGARQGRQLGRIALARYVRARTGTYNVSFPWYGGFGYFGPTSPYVYSSHHHRSIGFPFYRFHGYPFSYGGWYGGWWHFGGWPRCSGLFIVR